MSEYEDLERLVAQMEDRLDALPDDHAGRAVIERTLRVYRARLARLRLMGEK